MTENNLSAPALTAGILTCSYRGDFEACCILARSIDTFAPGLEHHLLVPRKDLEMFAPLATPKRRILVQEDALPWWMFNMPMPSQPWRTRLRLPRRDMFLSLRGLPVRGWIAQQMMKLISARNADWDVVLHMDSDNFLFRPLTEGHLVAPDGRVRFYRNPGSADMETHHRWHRAAAQLLGLPERDYFGADYIDAFVVWQRRHVVGLTDRISQVTGIDWVTKLARMPHFAEYILYGIYVDHVLKGDPGHYATSESLTLARWTGDFVDEADEAEFLGELKPWHVACQVQSTIPITTEHRKNIMSKLVEAGKRQPAEILAP